ncbi:MAG TPA: inosine/xanthosine triphosphatase [Candidatus Thermoplasmatota archaeon]|nr:inosine/xanthosine triphosphatase [Candidatus Thermoplasmatota archaeon]
MRVCLGGTFEPFHAGHEALLSAAAQGASEVFVGITDGALARREGRKVAPWTERAKKVESYLKGIGYKGKVVARALTEPMGPAAREPYDAIAASPETVRGAEAINAARVAAKLSPLRLIRVPHVLGDDLLPISGTAIADGRIDAKGKRAKPVQIAVGSANPVKVAGIGAEFGRILADRAHGAGGLKTDVKPFDVGSGVPEQPRGAQVLKGARNRARKARDAWPGCDYAVGVEAGLVRYPEEKMHLEAQACVVIDRNGWETHGWGPGFQYPAWVTEGALRGTMVSEILGPVANDPRLGATTGAIGYLTGGRFDRSQLTQMAVLMAFLPRFKRDLYLGPAPG